MIDYKGKGKIMKMTGSKILLESLKKENVDIMFGYPGGSVIPIFDALYDEKGIKLILPRHEQAAVHAADGYARATGKVGVCLATSGPGATNLITGIATAYLDSIPLVAITGQVKTHLIGNDAFQEADVTGITRPVTKHNFLVKDVKDLAKTMKEAFHIARTGRPGPVVIDLPVDVQTGITEFKYPKEVHLRSYNPKYKGHKGQIEKLAKAIANAKKPVIYAGGGITLSNASKELTAFVKKTQIPVTTTLMALGTFPEDDNLSLGMPGMHGTAYANHAIQESDLLISLASRFDDRVTGKIELFAPNAKIVHVDIDPSSISKNVEVDLPIVGCVKNVLIELNKIVKKADTKEWLKTIDGWKKKNPLTYTKDKKLRPQYVIEQIDEITKGDALIVTEVGQHQMWAAQFFNYTKPRRFISSGGLGTMGFGFPASLGVQLAFPDEKVFVIAGDGSIQMNTQRTCNSCYGKNTCKDSYLK